jgi:hypothetical protein
MTRNEAASSSSASNDTYTSSDTARPAHGFRPSRRGTPMQVKTDGQKK